MSEFDELIKLKELYDSGILTDVEYEAQKAAFFSRRECAHGTSRSPVPAVVAPPSYAHHSAGIPLQSLPHSSQVYGGLPTQAPFTFEEAGDRASHRVGRFEPAVMALLQFVTFA